MIELYLSKVDESSETEQAGKLYARVSYKETMGIHEMAEHMAHHNTAFSEMGTLAEGAKTGPAVKVIKLLAQSTGDFTREELKKDVKFSWTDKTKAEIAAAKGESTSGGGASGGSNDSGDGPTNEP